MLHERCVDHGHVQRTTAPLVTHVCQFRGVTCMEPKSLMKLCRDGESASTTPENSLLMPLSRARSFATPPRFPFGIDDLNPDPSRQPGDPSLARCYVRGCPHILTRPARGKRGRACPEHGIYCHRSCTGGTYSYHASTNSTPQACRFHSNWNTPAKWLMRARSSARFT